VPIEDVAGAVEEPIREGEPAAEIIPMLELNHGTAD